MGGFQNHTKSWKIIYIFFFFLARNILFVKRIERISSAGLAFDELKKKSYTK